MVVGGGARHGLLAGAVEEAGPAHDLPDAHVAGEADAGEVEDAGLVEGVDARAPVVERVRLVKGGDPADDIRALLARLPASVRSAAVRAARAAMATTSPTDMLDGARSVVGMVTVHHSPARGRRRARSGGT